MGHLYYLTSRTEEARDCYERTLAYTTEASDMHAIYLRLASIYLEKGEVRLFIFFCNNLEFYVSDLKVGPNACLEMTEFESESEFWIL